MRWYDDQVASLPFETEPQFVATPSGRTHILVAGPKAAPPVLLLHGMGMNAAAMIGAVRALGEDFRVYAVDTVGMPGKSDGTRPERNGEGYPLWLEAVLVELGLESAHFVGVSFGGWMILKLAARAPSRVRTASLLDTGGLVPFTLRGQLVAGLGAVRYVLRPTPGNGLRAARPLFASGAPLDPDFVVLLTLGYRHAKLDVDRSGLPVIRAEDLSGFDGPAFVSFGAEDVFFDVERACARAWVVLSGLETCEIIPERGHAPTSDQGALLYDRVRSFLFKHAV
ncbi:alpha/beta fold hydrolase [Rubrivirga sp.]|uniref:alpha/beta fold hydrolase n=1 Tax=Rubrivirga sp. TaxID=1885344 RepID=UPI003C710E20